jgi:hypothetical protein
MNETRFEIEDVMRCLRNNATLIDKFIGLSLPDDEDVDQYILELVGDNLNKCEKRLEKLIRRRKQ